MRVDKWVMPEEKDAAFSAALIESVSSVAESLGAMSFTIEVSEKFVSEDTPHYHMKVGFGLDDVFSSSILRVDYEASTDTETSTGSIFIKVRTIAFKSVSKVLVAMVFALYIKAIEQHYPEWKTIYDLGSMSIV